MNVLVKITTDEGLWGIGEAAPFEPVTGESAATVLEALKLFRTGLIGMDPLDVEGIHRMMDRLLSGNTSAKAAVDIALYDIKGKLMGQPLYKVLGGSVNQIITDMTVGIDTPEAMAAEARERVEKDGFTILKIKAGINPIEDLSLIHILQTQPATFPHTAPVTARDAPVWAHSRCTGVVLVQPNTTLNSPLSGDFCFTTTAFTWTGFPCTGKSCTNK